MKVAIVTPYHDVPLERRRNDGAASNHLNGFPQHLVVHVNIALRGAEVLVSRQRHNHFRGNATMGELGYVGTNLRATLKAIPFNVRASSLSVIRLKNGIANEPSGRGASTI